jgi:type VI secretion system secreted protein VgrG
VGCESDRFRGYRLEVVPQFWLLTLAQPFRVFEKVNTVDIIKKVLADYGISPTIRLTGTYSLWDLCTQYRETDFNFLSRLMEHEGIFYFFEHSNGKNTLVLGDSPQAFQVCPDQASYNYAPDIGPGDGDWFGDWNAAHQLRTGSYRLWDWHIENANRFESISQTAKAVAGNTSYKISDFPGDLTPKFNAIQSTGKVPAEGTAVVKRRMEETETGDPLYQASGSIRALSSGQKFSVEGSIITGDYVVVSAEHSGMQHPPYVYGDSDTPLTYTNSLTCIKYGTQYRPPRIHIKPLVQGPQTAIVTDRPDKYARVRVKFHWGDPQGVSAWVRVVQKWAGPQYGAIFIPRPGHEVVVEFENGDPDRPLITGCVYNSQNMPPYTLPDNFTQSGVKTRSLDSGGDGGSDEFNELRFEDKKGSEDIYFHAQKDLHRVVENDDDLKVGHDQTIEIKNNRTETVKDGNEKVTIETGNREIYVNTGNDKHQVKTGNREAIIDMGNESLTVKMGNQTTKINLGKSETEAMQSIELKVGQSSVKLDQMGVTIKGMMINIEAQIQMQQKALLYQADGSALVQIKGGITMIN